MADIAFIERVIESSPVIVLVLGGACVVLWRRAERQDVEYRALAKQVVQTMAENSAAIHALTKAVDHLSNRIDDAR